MKKKTDILNENTEEVLCTIRSHGTEKIMLGRKKHSGTSKTKELVPVQLDFPEVPMRYLRPNIVYFVLYDRILQRDY